jgi:hypothetical protein
MYKLIVSLIFVILFIDLYLSNIEQLVIDRIVETTHKDPAVIYFGVHILICGTFISIFLLCLGTWRRLKEKRENRVKSES